MKSEHVLIISLLSIGIIGGIAIYQVSKNRPIDLSLVGFKIKT